MSKIPLYVDIGIDIDIDMDIEIDIYINIDKYINICIDKNINIDIDIDSFNSDAFTVTSVHVCFFKETFERFKFFLTSNQRR